MNVDLVKSHKGLQNGCDTKCWLNVVLQAIYSSPKVRQTVLLRLKEMKNLTAIQDWYLQFFTHGDMLIMDYPWELEESEFFKFGNKADKYKQIQDIESAIELVSADLLYPSMITKIRPYSSSVGVSESNYLLLPALKSLDVSKGEKFLQSPGKNNQYYDCISLESKHYHTRLQPLLDEHIQLGTVIETTGELLILVMNNSVETDMVEFHEGNNSGAAEKLGQSSYFSVLCKIIPEPILKVNEVLFILTAVFEHGRKNKLPHFTVSVNANLTQQWVQIDDESICAVTAETNLIQNKFGCPTAVGFVYQRLFNSIRLIDIPLYKPSLSGTRSSTRLHQNSDAMESFVVDLQYMQEMEESHLNNKPMTKT